MESKAIGYIPTIFVMSQLPFREKEGELRTHFERELPFMKMSLVSTKGIPYGKYGRLVLALITTIAVLDKENDGDTTVTYASQAELCEALRLPKTRAADIIEQLERFSETFFTVKISLRSIPQLQIDSSLLDIQEAKKMLQGKEKKTDTYIKTKNIRFISEFSRIVTGNTANANYDLQMTIAREYKKLCSWHAVPIDYDVYVQIVSPLGKDLYAWFVYRNNIIRENEEKFISRDDLLGQFVDSISETVKNRRQSYQYIKEQIEEIKSKYYPGLQVTLVADGSGIYLRKSEYTIYKNLDKGVGRDLYNYIMAKGQFVEEGKRIVITKERLSEEFNEIPYASIQEQLRIIQAKYYKTIEFDPDGNGITIGKTNGGIPNIRYVPMVDRLEEK